MMYYFFRSPIVYKRYRWNELYVGNKHSGYYWATHLNSSDTFSWDTDNIKLRPCTAVMKWEI